MIFKCYFCPVYNNKLYKLEEHLRTHTKESPYFCKYCTHQTKEFKTSSRLRNHCVLYHPKECARTKQKIIKLSFNCYFCSKPYPFLSQMAKHLRKHTLELPYHCNNTPCSKSYANRSALSLHLKHCEFNDNRIKTFTCYFCPKLVLSTNTLLKHYCTHTKEKHTRCKNCHARFRYPNQLIRHQGSCKLLSEPCLVRSKPERQCKLCGLKLFGGTALFRHIRKEHTRDNKWKCYFCKKFFARIKPGHMAIHTGERHYLCQLCPAEFKYDIFLQRHNLRHMNENPEHRFSKTKSSYIAQKYPKCYFCGIPFQRYRDLLQHMNTHHTGERTYQCSRCKKVFFSLSSAVKKNCANHY